MYLSTFTQRFFWHSVWRLRFSDTFFKKVKYIYQKGKGGTAVLFHTVNKEEVKVTAATVTWFLTLVPSFCCNKWTISHRWLIKDSVFMSWKLSIRKQYSLNCSTYVYFHPLSACVAPLIFCRRPRVSRMFWLTVSGSARAPCLYMTDCT